MQGTHTTGLHTLCQPCSAGSACAGRTEAVKALSDAQLLVSNTHKATDKATPTAVDIEVAATVRTNIVLSHRSDAQRARVLTMSLLGELESQTDNQELFAQLGELLIDPLQEGDSAASEARHRKAMLSASLVSRQFPRRGKKT